MTDIWTILFCSIKDYHGKTRFTARVIHSIVLKMSIVQIYYKDSLVALSHTIGNEQLPVNEQVCHKALSVSRRDSGMR